MTASQIADWAIAFWKRVLTQCIYWFQDITSATGTTSLWAGIIVIVAVFSIVLIPLRGGADLTRGAIGHFIMGRVNRSKPTDHQD